MQYFYLDQFYHRLLSGCEDIFNQNNTKCLWKNWLPYL